MSQEVDGVPATITSSRHIIWMWVVRSARAGLSAPLAVPQPPPLSLEWDYIQHLQRVRHLHNMSIMNHIHSYDHLRNPSLGPTELLTETDWFRSDRGKNTAGVFAAITRVRNLTIDECYSAMRYARS